MLTLNDLKTALIRDYDECDLLDVLEIDSQMIVNAFSDVIEEKFDYLVNEMELLGGEEDYDYE